MGCRCTNDLTAQEKEIRAQQSVRTDKPESLQSNMPMFINHTVSKSHIGRFSLSTKAIITSFNKKNTNSDVILNSNSYVQQHSVITNHYDSSKLNISSDIFRKENKKSVYYFYDLLQVIGRGTFGEVRLAKHKASGEQRAIKIIEKHCCDEKIVDEIRILQQLDHPNILQLYEFFQDQQFYYIVIEYCIGGELFDKIIKLKSISEMRTAKIMQQILSAVVYCHKHFICHRDLKPENLLLEEDNIDSNIKVIDFGTSKYFKQNERMKEKFGTPYYIAPEVLKKDYNEKCDVWSCGVILYILLSGYPPFGGKNNEIIMKRVIEGKYNFNRKEWNVISPKAKALITKMLTYNPEKRISAEEALSDIWITQYSQKINNTNATEDIAQSLEMLKNFKVKLVTSSTKIYKLPRSHSMRHIYKIKRRKEGLESYSGNSIKTGMACFPKKKS